MGIIERNPQARQGDRHRPGAHRHRGHAPTSGCRSPRAPMPRCCWRSCTRCSPRTWSHLGAARRPRRRASTPCAQAAADWSPERVAAVTGIDAERIRALARELAATARAVVYGRIGMCNQEFGSLASWLVDVVNILTGHFDTPGGAMFPRPAAWSVTVQPHARPRGRRCPSSAASAPGCAAPRRCSARCRCRVWPRRSRRRAEGQIKALITVAGNPVLSTPGGHKLDEVLPTLDAMIAVDLWLNETTRHADVILPGLVAAGAAAPRRPDPQLRDQQHRQLLARRCSRPTTPTRPEEWEILIRLTGLCTGHARRGRRRRRHRRRLLRLHGVHPGPRRRRDPQPLRPRRTGAHPRPDAAHRAVRRPVRREPRRADPGEAQGATRTASTSGRWCRRCPRCSAPPTARSDWPRSTCSTTCPGWPRVSTATPDDLVLVSRRHLRSNNSWLHNVAAADEGHATAARC